MRWRYYCTMAFKVFLRGICIFKIILNMESLTTYMKRVLLCQNDFVFPEHQYPQGISWGPDGICACSGCITGEESPNNTNQVLFRAADDLSGLLWKERKTFLYYFLFFSSLFPYLYGAYQCKHIFLKEKASSSSFFQ